jgi:DNA-binding CsgD family transcriptional regulator
VAVDASKGPSSARSVKWPLRGRSAQLDAVLRALGAVSSGQSVVVLARGEPGIGKTAFVTEVVDRAARLGLTTAYAAARAEDRIAPLSSLGPALRFGGTPLIGSDDFMGLAPLLEQPLWLAERLATLLERRAQDGPLLLAVDDAQWCDPLTAFILRLLPKRLAAAPAAWLLATRDEPGGGLAEQIADAARPDLPVVPVRLGLLPEDAVFAVAVDRLGTQPAPAVLDRLADARGNPFLVVQLLAGLFEPDGRVSAEARLPAGLLEGVRHRVAATSERCRELLRTGAVLGHAFPLTDVADLLGTSTAQLTEALTEAIAASLLTDEGSTVQFRHELLREAVYEDLPPSVRGALHSAIADRLLAVGRGYAAVAPHVIATAEPGDAAAADVLRRAAHEVLETMSTTAVTFIRQAFELTDADDPAWGEIGAEAVAILLCARQFAAATEFADALLAAGVSARLRARVSLLLLPRLWATGRRTELAERSRNPGAGSGLALAPELAARLGGYRALAEGKTVEAGGTDQVARVLAMMAAAEQAGRGYDYVRAHQLFASARAAAQEATGCGLPEVGQLAAREVLALARRDDIDGALVALDDGTRFPDSWQAPQLALLRAQLAFGAGQLDSAAGAAATAAALMSELGDDAFERELRCLAALIALLRGDNVQVRAGLAAARQAGEDLSLARALLADAEGDPRAAAEVVALARADDWFAWPENLLVSAACSAHHHGAAGTVRAAAAVLGERARRNPDVPSMTGAWLLVEALMTNDYAPAMERLRHSPRALLAAQADEEFGRFQLDAGGREIALDSLDAARDRYAELGAAASATRVQRILRAAGARRRRWAPVPRRPDSGWEALTDMERRVALLVADGHTNRSAAQELVLSPSTVSSHLRAVFSKLGIHSRVQLTHVVLRGDGTAARRPLTRRAARTERVTSPSAPDQALGGRSTEMRVAAKPSPVRRCRARGARSARRART